ncbi:hypothetical protein AM354_21465 [Serratia marcescens]|uniref:hypothetical protein n=1 Tax=Serratia marcescens TaxID=615 RepID=UPI000CE669A1|nr:hypothetical protein [Serratia marcescens]AVE51983.1 hypothetical protein AM354_21465 [Serratia marcescens]
MDNKLSELSKPVAWRYRYTKPGITDSHGEAWVGDWKFVTDEVNCNPAPNYQKCALYSQEYVSALLEEIGVRERSLISNCVDYEYDLIEMKRRADAAEQRVAELEAIRADASQVFTEIGNELGCNPDNESIMMAIDDLKATQMTGPLALMLERLAVLERITEGVDQLAIDGGWTARGMSQYAKSLEAKLATPVRLPRTIWYEHDDLAHEIPVLEKKKVAAEIRAAGFTVEGDE